MNITLNKYNVTFTFDFNGYSDYYSGHGHVWDKDLKACILISVPIRYTETVKEIIDMILQEIRGTEIDFNFLTEDSQVQEEISDFLTEDVIETAIRKELKEGTKDTDDFFFKMELELDEDDESPCLIGYVHVY